MKIARNIQPKVVVAHLGARLHYGVAVSLNRSGLLEQLFTDTYTGKGSWLYYPNRFIFTPILKGDKFRRLSLRSSELPSRKVTCYNLLGLFYWFQLKNEAIKNNSITNVYVKYGSMFLQKVSRSKHMNTANVVYGFNQSSLELFDYAKRKGIYCIGEQMIAPINVISTMIAREFQNWPGWQTKGVMGWDRDIWDQREVREWNLADTVIAPSDYVRTALINEGVTEEKIITIPYAVPIETYKGRVHDYDGTRPINVLFVGTVDLRKGVPYLLEALRKIGPKKVKARFFGSIFIDRDKLDSYKDVASFYGSVPRDEVINHYDWADIFVLPSLVEGSATVTYEARACGLPTITTPNTGSWTMDGTDGLTVPIKNSDAIAEALLDFIKHPQLVQMMSTAALKRASDFSWEAYQDRLSNLIHKKLQ